MPYGRARRLPPYPAVSKTNLLWLPPASRRGWDRARVPRILQPHLLDTQHVEHPAPPEGQKVRVIGLPGLVARHVLVRPVAGVGHIFTTGAVALDTDTRGVDIQRSENATAESFSKNLVFAPPR